MAPPTNPSRKRASKVAVNQLLTQLTGGGRDETGKGGPGKKRRRDEHDPRWQKMLSMGGGKSRKERRQEARRFKKARMNAFHQKKSVSVGPKSKFM